MLFKSVSRHGDKVALISKDTGTITYKEIEKKISTLKKKVKKKTLIFLISQNSIAPILLYIYAIKNNCVIILIDIKTSMPNISNLLNIYEPSYIAAPNDWIKKFNIKKYKLTDKILDYSIYKTNYKLFPKMNPELCLLLPTSGSMGSPKFVRISKKNITSNTHSIIKYLKIRTKDRTITNMPFNYSYMLSIINTHIEVGASIYVTKESLLQKEFWNEFRKNKITSFNGVPYIYDIIIKLGLNKIYNENFYSLTQAGGKMNNRSIKTILKFCKRYKIKFTAMYGQTEASPRMTYLHWKYAQKKTGSIGKAIPGTKIWIEDNDGKKINKIKKTGELIFQGKNVSMGYAENIQDLQKEDENHGILKTGDLAYFDKDKFFFIKGRKNRIIKIVGNRFNLDEIEERMRKKRIQIACKNINDVLFIFHEKKSPKKKILEYISKITGQNIINFKCILLKKFPRTLNGKINYKKL